MPESLTTLQLARRIADSLIRVVMLEHYVRDFDPTKDRAVQAVFQTLDETDSWFCRVSEDAQGATVLTEYEKGELFR